MKYLIMVPLLFAAGTALADDAAILTCRALADTSARLACYDAISVGARATAPAPAAPVASTQSPSAAPANPEQSFGMENVKRAEAPKSIESTLEGEFEGWGPNTQFRLANGQVWKVVDGSQAALPRVSKPKVKIVRNMFGTMFMEFEDTNASPKVRRVR